MLTYCQLGSSMKKRIFIISYLPLFAYFRKDPLFAIYAYPQNNASTRFDGAEMIFCGFHLLVWRLLTGLCTGTCKCFKPFQINILAPGGLENGMLFYEPSKRFLPKETHLHNQRSWFTAHAPCTSTSKPLSALLFWKTAFE